MPETVIGTRTKLELVSGSHGIIRVPLAQSFDYTPRYTERTLFEFDNTEAALVVTTFDGTDIRFDYFDTDSKLVDATFNDLDPGATITVHDPSALREFHAMLNVKSETDGLIFQSVLAKGCRVRGVAAAEPVREESRITVDAAARNVLRLKGAAMLYTRVLHDTPDVSVYEQSIPPNSDTDQNFPAMTPFKITLNEDAEDVYIPGDDETRKYIMVLKNGEEVTTGFTVSATEFEVTSAPADTDIWEVWTAYIDS